MAAVVREELMERCHPKTTIVQTNGHAIAVHDGHAVFEVFLGESIDGIEGFLGFGLVIAKQNFLNVRQTVAEEHVLGAEQADAAAPLLNAGSVSAASAFARTSRDLISWHQSRIA